MILNESFMKRILEEELDKRLNFILSELTTSYKLNGEKRSAISKPDGLRVRHKETGDEFELLGFVDGKGGEKMVKLSVPGSYNSKRVNKVRSKSKDYIGSLNSGAYKKNINKDLLEGEGLDLKVTQKPNNQDYILISLKELEEEYEL